MTVDAEWLSRLLFAARENLDMWVDVVYLRSRREPASVVNLIAEIDRFRAEQGWSPDGFGGE